MFDRFYVLSEKADADLEEISDYTCEEFGFNQAEKYLLEIESVFYFLFKNPFSGRNRTEIKEGLYSFPKDNHVIFYRIFSDHIRIIRVIYGSRNLPNSFLI